MAPLLPDELVPVLTTIMPLTPEVPASAVVIVNDPLDDAVLDPVVIVTAPPVAPGEIVAPAVNRISPPVPLLPLPTANTMLPPRPDVAVPVTKYKAPLLPLFPVPVLITIIPLIPEVPDCSVLMMTSPLAPLVLPPDVMDTLPPVAVAAVDHDEYPALNST